MSEAKLSLCDKLKPPPHQTVAYIPTTYRETQKETARDKPSQHLSMQAGTITAHTNINTIPNHWHLNTIRFRVKKPNCRQRRATYSERWRRHAKSNNDSDTFRSNSNQIYSGREERSPIQLHPTSRPNTIDRDLQDIYNHHTTRESTERRTPTKSIDKPTTNLPAYTTTPAFGHTPSLPANTMARPAPRRKKAATASLSVTPVREAPAEQTPAEGLAPTLQQSLGEIPALTLQEPSDSDMSPRTVVSRRLPKKRQEAKAIHELSMEKASKAVSDTTPYTTTPQSLMRDSEMKDFDQ